MKDRQAEFIDVADLRPGIYVYLDVGWMGHPFALNSFRINSIEQIETIRRLGIERIRYSPEQTISEEEFARTAAGEARPQHANPQAPKDAARGVDGTPAQAPEDERPGEHERRGKPGREVRRQGRREHAGRDEDAHEHHRVGAHHAGDETAVGALGFAAQPRHRQGHGRR